MNNPGDIRFSQVSSQLTTRNLLNRTKGDRVIWALVLLLVLVSLPATILLSRQAAPARERVSRVRFPEAVPA